MENRVEELRKRLSFLFSSGQYQTSIDIDGIENVYLGGQMIWNSK